MHRQPLHSKTSERLRPSYSLFYQISKRISDFVEYSIAHTNIVQRRQLIRQWETVKRLRSKRKAVVICGGPSFTPEIARYIVSIRKEIDVIALNWYSENIASEEIVPDFYVLSDPKFLDPPKSDEKRTEKLYDYINRSGSVVIAPNSKRWREARFKGGVINFNDREAVYFRNIKPDLPRGYRSNTSFKAIAAAINMGYDAVAVLGLDYNYPRKLFLKNGRLILRDEHHYGVKDSDYSVYFESVGHALNWWSIDYTSAMSLRCAAVFNVSEVTLMDAFRVVSTAEFLAGQAWISGSANNKMEFKGNGN